MSEKYILKISVRNLVEFVLRTGDLTTGFSGSARAAEGSKVHRRLQKAQGEDYQAEVALTYETERADMLLKVSGRADGVIVSEDENGLRKVTIDEIKSTTRPVDLIRETDNPVYWAQAKCYAYFYAVQNGLNSIQVRLTYCQYISWEMKQFYQEISVADLARFFSELIDRYYAWAQQMRQWADQRDSSAREMEFPFASYREGQRRLAVAVYQTIRSGRKLYAQAPTGTGKTMAVLFPAVKAMGMGLVEKIFFLTAKTVTRSLVEEAFDKLRRQGLRYKTLTITAKDKICFLPEAACDPEECPYSKGYFDRLNTALADIWRVDAFTRPVVEEYARKHNLCPFEFSLDLALWADCIICDYNYVFDPQVYLRRFFQEEGGDYCFLADEAHNLVDRAREMFSASLDKKTFLELRRSVKTGLPKLAKAVTAVNTCLLKLGKLCSGESNFAVKREMPQDLFAPLRKFIGVAEEWLVRNEPADYKDAVREVYFAVYAFLRIAENYDEHYVTYIERNHKEVKIKLFCVEPSFLLGQAMERGRAGIFFSATLTPLDYFAAVLGGNEQDGWLTVASPFARNHLCLMVADQVSTTYQRRAQTYDRVVEHIAAAVDGKKGNYLIFLPSYAYMEEIADRFAVQYPRMRTIRQTGSMTEEERLIFLDHFTVGNQEPLVGFVVLGGIFGEGIDLTGTRLLGAVVVGVGLPQLCREKDIIRDYFNALNGNGFEYAYLYPGMNKVLQAAGRVIRTETDKGIVLLIDERFSQARYRRLFPPEWRGAVAVKDCRDIAGITHLFWQDI
ncbi:dead2 [Lucifera butyrica]|uniref:Dead2 n=1 Tax=Lucifera butyrica TaxID=1351585 RepID=A0A498RCK4_9FIRM|nr:ATP-dependent DNA helicase [Lucifera butyrica]VBB09151.1 dead2 [Lucifera butyrica]